VAELSVVVARDRLAVLTAHLAASVDCIEVAPALEPHCLSAQTVVPPPGNLRGSLTIVDERTGKKYQVPVSEEGTVKATELKKVCIYMFAYEDWIFLYLRFNCLNGFDFVFVLIWVWFCLCISLFCSILWSDACLCSGFLF
jgi:hypothetical protein